MNLQGCLSTASCPTAAAIDVSSCRPLADYPLIGYCNTMHAVKTLVEDEGEMVPGGIARNRNNGERREMGGHDNCTISCTRCSLFDLQYRPVPGQA
jgi:hypothetical protein